MLFSTSLEEEEDEELTVAKPKPDAVEQTEENPEDTKQGETDLGTNNLPQTLQLQCVV